MTAPIPMVDCHNSDLIKGLGGSDSGITPLQVRKALSAAGLLPSDPRLEGVLSSLSDLPPSKLLTPAQFLDIASDNLTLLHRVATRELAIADFPAFTSQLEHVKSLVEPDHSGANADYIPVLRDAPSDRFGIAFCSVDGQFFELGDSRDDFSIQSTSKSITFALALERLGTESVLKWCGIEPSGRPFNDMTLLSDGRPFNPMVNSGALMTAAVLATAYPDLLAQDKIGKDGAFAGELCKEVLQPVWSRLTSNGIVGDIGFSEETFLSERATADGNTGISFMMKARKGLPGSVQPQTMLDFYLRACSITANTASMSILAGTLANGGRNPITGDQVLSADVVKKTLSVLSFCGFYDSAGDFFFYTGMPSKSGVSGVVFLVLPNVGGFAFFSPRLDKYGNSVRGSAFAKHLVSLFTFHSFDVVSSMSNGCKLDPRFSCDFSKQRNISRLRWALRAGGKQAKQFDELLVSVCIRVAGADGSIDDEELDELKKVYKSVMHAELCDERVKTLMKKMPIETGKKGLDAMYELVHAQEKFLNDVEKDLLIEATVKITLADHGIAQQERDILATVARALYVDPTVMDVLLKFWEAKQMENGTC